MNDRYLDKKECVVRLFKELKNHGNIIIAYDFDNTVYDYHGVGDTYEKIIQILKDFKPYAKFIVFTANDDHILIKSHLMDNDIPYDTINEDILNVTDARKIYYNILLDDRAGLWSAYDTLKELLHLIELA